MSLPSQRYNTLSVVPYLDARRPRALAIGSTVKDFRDSIKADLAKWAAITHR